MYLDTGFSLLDMPSDLFVRMVHRHGADRILFGTDSPWADQADAVAHIRALPLTEAEKADILWRNAKELLELTADS